MQEALAEAIYIVSIQTGSEWIRLSSSAAAEAGGIELANHSTILAFTFISVKKGRNIIVAIYSSSYCLLCQYSLTKEKLLIGICAIYACSFKQLHDPSWKSAFVKTNKDGSLQYIPDEKGNIIPDFSQVGYYRGDKKIPDVAIVKTISPAADSSSEAIIQAAIDELSTKTADANGLKELFC